MYKICVFSVFISVAWLISCSPSSISDEVLSQYVEARTAYSAGDFKNAEEELNNIRKERAINPQVSFLLAKTLFMQNRPEESRSILQTILRKHPEYSDARLWLVRAAIAMGDISFAVENLETALTWNSEDPRFLAAMAACHELNGDMDKALDYYRRAMLFEEDMVGIYLSMANIYGRNRLDIEKIRLLDKAEALASENGIFTDAIQTARGSK